MKIIVAAVGKVRADYIRQGCEDYLKRARKMSPIEVREIKTSTGGDAAATKKSEGKKIAATLAGLGNYITIALSDKGKQLDSKAFAKLVGNIESSGAQGVVFIVGGAYGLADEIVRESDYTLSLGPMTMSHETARFVLMEQIYRAQTVLRGVPYAK